MERMIDQLGRVVIPVEFRKIYGLDKKVKMVETENGLLLMNTDKKVSTSDEK